MNSRYSIAELASLVGGTLRGDGAAVVTGVADLLEANSQQASWVSSAKYADKVASSRAGVVLVPADFGDTPAPAILCPRIDRSVALLLGAFQSPISRPAEGLHPTASIHASVILGVNARIGPNVVIDAEVSLGVNAIVHAGAFIGRGTSVGDDCEFWPGVVVRDGCTIGHRVIIHSNSVIGADGFGYFFHGGEHKKVPHIGGVILEDDVEIGACTCIDRAKFGHTIIGRGTKIDNLVQIAHNVRVGRRVVIAGMTGVAGSTRIGDDCVFGGRVTLVDNIAIGDQVQMGSLALVTKDTKPRTVLSGRPAQEIHADQREKAHVRRLPKLIEQVKALAERVERLEAAAHHQP